jgi:hypothetical protein
MAGGRVAGRISESPPPGLDNGAGADHDDTVDRFSCSGGLILSLLGFCLGRQQPSALAEGLCDLPARAAAKTAKPVRVRDSATLCRSPDPEAPRRGRAR